jgi:hypothetical protein
MRFRLTCFAVLAGALAVPASASAIFYPGAAVDGPSAAIQRVGDLDVARDGSGGVVYVKQDGGVDHVFLSRIVDGNFQPPERLDGGFAGASAQPVIAASDGGRLAIAFVNGGALFTVVRPAGANGLPAPAQVAAAASDPSIDMSINGVGYVTFTSNGDVLAARLEHDGTTFGVLGASLDLAAAHEAGTGTGRSRVVVSADGTALATWGETGDDGRTHVIARRLFGTRVSAFPQDITLDQLDGHAGGSADSPVLDVEDDSSYAWVAFRQSFDDGGVQRSRVVARRLVGSAFDPPAQVDGLSFPAPEGADSPTIALSGKGQALTGIARQSSGMVVGDLTYQDAFQNVFGVNGSGGGQPRAAEAEGGDGVLAWLQGTAVQAQHYDALPTTRVVPDGAVANIADPSLGPVDPNAGFDVASNRAGDVIMVFVQGTGDQRRLVAATYDRPPGSFTTYTGSRFRSVLGKPLVWSSAFDLWGPLTYTVFVDGKAVGQSQTTKLAPTQPLPDGVHTWRIVATDRRGQTSATKPAHLRLDSTPPKLTVRLTGTRKAGKVLKVAASATDASGTSAKASGLLDVKIVLGDRSATILGRKAAHAYRRGTYVLTVTATDKAGNATVVRKQLKIKR